MRIFLRAITAGGGLFLASAGFAAELKTPESLPVAVLTNASQIRSLIPAQAALALPVELTGVVMDNAAPNRQAIILQDQTAGIYVLGNQSLFTNCLRGDKMTLKGVTDPGGFAPIVVAATARKLGTTAIPEAQPVTYQQLISGAPDAQWVEIKGVVRRWYQPDGGSDIRRIIVAVEGGPVTVRFLADSGIPSKSMRKSVCGRFAFISSTKSARC